MAIPRHLTIVLALLLGACRWSGSDDDVTHYDFRPSAPETVPVVAARGAELIPYPDVEVSYVDVAGAEVYHCRGLFYCYHYGNWYYARRLGGEWTFVEMKQVPRDLFRVRGAQPPLPADQTIQAAAPGEE